MGRPFTTKETIKYYLYPFRSIFTFTKRLFIVPKFGADTHANFNLKESLSYIGEVFEDYLHYSGLNHTDLNNKTIIEIGPGDNLGVALKFLEYGAKKVIAIDRFPSPKNSDRGRKVYEALLISMSSEGKTRAERGIKIKNKDFIINNECLEYKYGISAENLDEYFPTDFAYIIVSRAVFEHLFDIRRAFIASHKLLCSDGLSIHKIDLRNHNMFSESHPLSFLYCPDSFWDWQAKIYGWPNRKLMNDYLNVIKITGFEIENLFITRLLGKPQKIKPHVKENEVVLDQEIIEICNTARTWLPEKYRE